MKRDYLVRGALAFAVLVAASDSVVAQGRGGRGGNTPPDTSLAARRSGQGRFATGNGLQGVLNHGSPANARAPMTAVDSAVLQVVARLDFQSYKNIIKGLAAFGDREQGTERNARGRLDRAAASELGLHDRTREVSLQNADRHDRLAPRGSVCNQGRQQDAERDVHSRR